MGAGEAVLVEEIGTAVVTRRETEQPKESENTEHGPLSGADATTRTFTGSYGWTFNDNALDGLCVLGGDEVPSDR